ncbi:MAG: hypothetical protein G3M70_01840 [Candidatus Nitronauta litoralis]|uniref:Uncharacterized protein n=1 Tax=Candidatus Nitronauta litoralis TaxID=2705533 RepID=A0A7T0FYM9_9BACT|nr:MAG: hypothetical protein G3M70_01840 [Candidatus Nitronauta litoralis]
MRFKSAKYKGFNRYPRLAHDPEAYEKQGRRIARLPHDLKNPNSFKAY